MDVQSSHLSNETTPDRGVRIPTDSFHLEGDLFLPDAPWGFVIFSHGSGSSRHSPRNKFVASRLQEGHVGSLLIDLLSPEEDEVRATRFDIDLLTQRLMHTVTWAQSNQELQNLPIGLFGASTGAASALRVAALLGNKISAVVSRGGRPDLAGASLRKVTCPCLFIVGGDDYPVVPLNEEALRFLSSKEKLLTIIPGATHLFEERGTLEEAARLSVHWFQEHLPKGERGHDAERIN